VSGNAGFGIVSGHSNGGPSASATLRITNCAVSGNAGVGISNFGVGILHATLTITNCTVSGNRGGGISNISTVSEATLTVSKCTISGNSGSNGGGIDNKATGGFCCDPQCGRCGSLSTVAISNSTLSGNSATGDGGAVYNNGVDIGFVRLSVNSCTISDNSAPNGGGIYVGGSSSLGLGDTILKAGSSGHNIFNNGGAVTSLGYNLASDNGGGFLTGPGDQINTQPRLGPLQDNGGPTLTHALLPGSPAINRGNPNFTAPPFFDQRGPRYHRVVNGRIDIGAFEVQ